MQSDAVLRVVERMAAHLGAEAGAQPRVHVVEFDNRLNWTVKCFDYDFEMANLNKGLAGAAPAITTMLDVKEYAGVSTGETDKYSNMIYAFLIDGRSNRYPVSRIFEFRVNGTLFRHINDNLPTHALSGNDVRWRMLEYGKDFKYIDIDLNFGSEQFRFYKIP